MLQTIREFGLEQLDTHGEGATIRQCHAEWYLSMAEVAEPELDGPRQIEWPDWLEANAPNLHAGIV